MHTDPPKKERKKKKKKQRSYIYAKFGSATPDLSKVFACKLELLGVI